MSVSVTVENIEKEFGIYPALRGASLKVHGGELMAILGPSGSGKTTLLRVGAGLQQPDACRVMFHELDAATLSLRERRLGFAFHPYALFRRMASLRSIRFGPRTS